MTPPLDPQRIAADPAISAFVTANAGSGKTKTLIDRVARLLLGGAEPAAILCVTYTKAAAAEMQHRLFDRLGKWCITPDEALRAEIADLVDRPAHEFDAAALSKARSLFAKALETPGGLKIQTIHAFCEKLLRRFPIEAGVSPGFQVMDDGASSAVAQAALHKLADHVTHAGDVFSEAYARFSVALDFASFEAMFATFQHQRSGIGAYLDRCGGLEGVIADLWEVCGFPEPTTADEVAAEAMADLDRVLWRSIADVLSGGGKTDIKCADLMRAVAVDPDATLEDALAALFTEKGVGTPAAWPAKTSGLKSREDLRERLLAEQERLEEAREYLRAAKVAEDSVAAMRLAALYLAKFIEEKQAHGSLDFSDLIEKTRDLLTRKVDAAWVLYKLDGGVSHILLDEAQDTAPEQWEILSALTEDFFAGAGAPGRDGKASDGRTLFIVGDEKQSIYSFQGAQPERLLIETQAYIARIEAVGRTGKAVPLSMSYRSTQQVLSFVDALFEAPEARLGLAPTGEDIPGHEAFRRDHPGCVDLWPLEREPAAVEREAWDAPLDVETEQGANRRLAERIAAEIKALVERGDAVFDKDARAWRPAHYGDVLVLVRRRKALFEEVLRALKRRGVPVAGADRLSLSAHIVFDDLLALGRFCLFPDDDLTLAALLKSPFCGLSDDDLYALAKPRGKATLWATLIARADERPLWREAHALLDWALTARRRRQPYEFYALFLGKLDINGISNRARALTRLGEEAADALDEFLTQITNAEARGVRDLETLVAEFAALDIVVKREMEGVRRQVRVMTAHGAKGLEAPIVFLPETTMKGGARGSPLLATVNENGDKGYVWCTSGKQDCEASATARKLREDKAQQEAYRLLYVGLTRARDRLILCGRIDARTKDENVGGWYAAARAAFAHAAIEGEVRTIDEDGVLRYGPDPVPAPPAAQVAETALHVLPDWARKAADPVAAGTRWAAPSALEAEEEAVGSAPSPLAKIEGLGRYRRGEVIHRLLQLLPDIAPAERRSAAARLLAAERDLTDAQRTEMTAAAFGVLEDDRFAAVFGPGSRAEAALAGAAAKLPKGMAISGRVDRLVVAPDRVLVVDYKTNRPSPDRIEDADPAYLAQMAVYAAVLAEIFPGREIEAAIVWTDGPKLMAVPEKVRAAALSRLF
ncbi:double-strand break repair helicase AddA [Caulobacter hibisci]|uniref:DNA 3'-5' helicase n=1 Tax=Caulobacter hibisci TaxID=2035993 RepID=A0ABS0T360_9CAUL|nr:double-strand break repair helicase AddA [Caulobacter hibisci]